MTSPELDPENVRVGATIRALREAYGLKANELAKGVGVSPELLSNVENGRSRATPKLRRAVAELLGVPLAAITVDGYEELAEATS